MYKLILILLFIIAINCAFIEEGNISNKIKKLRVPTYLTS